MFTENQFMDAQENICEDYSSGALDFEAAVAALVRMGFYPDEATTILAEYGEP